MSTGSSGYVRRELGVPPPEEETKQTKATSTAAFSHPAYRLYFIGQLVSLSGTWMQTVAQQVVVYTLTGSELALGVTTFAQGLPALILTPFAGVIVESFPRRQLLLITQTTMMILAFVQAVLQFAGILQVWHLIVLSFILGILTALDAPARQAIVVELVGREHLHSGIAMNSIMFNSARILGPMLGGIALAALGAGWCFLLNGISFIAVIFGLWVMRLKSIMQRPEHFEFLKPLVEGIRFASGHPIIAPLLLLAGINSCFGISFSTQIAPYAEYTLNNVDLGTSALLTASGIGTIIVSVLIARRSGQFRRGRVLTMATFIAPFGVILMGLIPNFYFSLPMAALASGGFICQFILTNMLIQDAVPDEFRGRVLSLYTLTFFGIGPFANLLLGVLAQLLSVMPALLIYGLASLLCGVYVVLRNPALRRME
ncbi:MAG: MFS transporter [Anaerolineae bacterium]|nr:MFS transporter [Anaerolineae bacterium]